MHTSACAVYIQTEQIGKFIRVFTIHHMPECKGSVKPLGYMHPQSVGCKGMAVLRKANMKIYRQYTFQAVSA